MRRNTVTVEKGYDENDILNIQSQLPSQLQDISEADIESEVYQNIQGHFLFVLAEDFYKDELTAEQITEMESYLPENYQEIFYTD
jgi:uncharacterized protein (DUF2267 family)|tara:strand:- start:253 stop:507 length:255 start_codon:yes stop_codon:yes gene_type:complete